MNLILFKNLEFDMEQYFLYENCLNKNSNERFMLHDVYELCNSTAKNHEFSLEDENVFVFKKR